MVKNAWDYKYSSCLKRLNLVGDETFYERIESITGIDYKRKKSGSKVKNKDNSY
jgi:hypothetical protein